MRHMQRLQTAEIGLLLHEARTSKRLTARDLGDLVGVAGSTITRIERGEIQPRYSTVLKIALATGHRLALEVGDTE